MDVTSGIAPFDERVGAFRSGAPYLLAGGPGTGKFPFLLHFLATGLREGERVALLCGVPQGEVLEQARHWGLDIEPAWRDGRLVLLGFQGEYPRRILHAPDPAEAFAELDRLLEGPVVRLCVDPGTLLWETRAGTQMAQRFVEWVTSTGAVTLAAFVSDLRETPGTSTGWVLQRAAGILHFARLPTGQREITVRRFQPPVETGPITLELKPGVGFTAPSGPIGRRRGDALAGNAGRALLLRIASGTPSDVESWFRREFEATDATDALDLIGRLRGGTIGAVGLFVDRGSAGEAAHVCETARPLTGAALIVVASERIRSADRARLIEAGADEVISHETTLREVASRVRRAVSCARDVDREDRPGAPPPPPIQEILETGRLREEVLSRMESEQHRHFTLLILRSVPGETTEILRETVRTEAGDLVGSVEDALAVLLQDARAAHAEIFLARAREALSRKAGVEPEWDVEVLGNPEDEQRIRALLSG